MGGIEFLDPVDPGPAQHRPARPAETPWAAPAPPRRTWAPLVRRLAAPACAALGVVLALVACWRTMFRLDEAAGPSFRNTVVVDAWGRTRAGVGGQHEPRFAVLLCAGAALLLAAGVLRALPGRRPGGTRTWPGTVATALAAAAAGLLAGGLGGAALEIDSVHDSLAAQAEQEAVNGGVASFSSHLSFGAMFWFGLAALALCLAALVLPLVRRPAPAEPAGPAGPAEPPAPAPVPRPAFVAHADDELLDG